MVTATGDDASIQTQGSGSLSSLCCAQPWCQLGRASTSALHACLLFCRLFGLSSPLKGEETYNQGKDQTRQFILSCFAGGVPVAGCAKPCPDSKVRDSELAERLDSGTIS